MNPEDDWFEYLKKEERDKTPRSFFEITYDFIFDYWDTVLMFVIVGFLIYSMFTLE